MARTTVVIKGTRDGLTIVLDDKADLPELVSDLEKKLESADDFLQGAKVTIQLGRRKLTLGEARQLVSVLRRYRGLQVVGFRKGKQRVKTLEGLLEERDNLELKGQASSGRGTPAKPLAKESWLEETYKEGYTLFVRRTLRSGQTINYHGNVVIIGDVNPGAEVIAGGDIIVLGVLRGIAHAGGAGDEDALVAALRLQPTQLRIANVFTRPPDGDMDAPDCPEVALLRKGTIVIEKYQTLGEMLRTYAEESIEEEKEELPWAK